MKKLLYFFVLIFIVFGFSAFQINAEEISNLSPELSMPQILGRVEGVGTYFEITGSEYLNLKLSSSKTIQLAFESIPEMVTIIFKPTASLTPSTHITISGFLPDTTYYKYQDNYHNLTEFTADENGGYSYEQDTSQSHLVFIQPRKSTKFIKDDSTGGDCSVIGVWDAATKTCALTKDVYETIQIDSNNITLDGNEHTITGTGTGYGVYLYQKIGVTIKNLEIKNFYFGIYLDSSRSNTIDNNIINLNTFGINVWWYSSGNTITNNTVISNKYYGINVGYSSSNTISNNNIDSNQYLWGIILVASGNNTLTGNIISNNKYNFGAYGWYDTHFDNNIDITNTINGKSIYYVKSADNVIYDNMNVGVFYCIRCNNVTIKNLALTQNFDGLYLWKTTNSRIENITSSNNRYGIRLEYSSNNTINNSIINSNEFHGIHITTYSNNNIITGNTISLNQDSGIGIWVSNNKVFNNNFVNNLLEVYNVGGNIFDLPLPIGGNYWSKYDTLVEGCNDINNDNICDSPYRFTNGQDNLPWKIKDGWSIPINPIPTIFWSQIQNSSVGWLNLRKTPGTQNKPVDDVIKTIPNGWVIKVATTTDSVGNLIQLDGYQWYGVMDITDSVGGWMATKSLSDGTVYLDYDFNNQSILEQKAAVQLDTSDKRKPIILQAVDNFYSTSTINSLYNPTGGLDGNNNFQKFIQGANFLKEFVLAIAAEESGPSFNNEICSDALDGGIGIIQITSLGFKGLGSGLYNKPKLTDCNKNTIGWSGNLSKYYSNAIQGIYANIKDGFRVLQEKYRSQCYEEISGGLYFTCNDIRRILIIWGYNGFGDEAGSYLNKIAAKLETLSNYFSGIIYSNTDQFIQKLRQADREKILALLESPGELQIEDKNGNITGVMGNTIQENIPNSLYEKDYKGVAIFFPKNPYIYRVIGTSSGTYSLNVDYFDDDIMQSFKAKDISITSGEIHEYLIDWDALFKNEIGVTIEVDQNGDKIIDKTFISDETFEWEDIFLQNNTIIDFEPNTFNLESNGIATAYIELPIGYNVNDISTSSIRLNKVVHVLSKLVEIGDYDKDGILDLMVKFEREGIKSVVATGEEIPIIIIGKVLYNGNYYYFKGQDVIKIINNKAETSPNSTVSRWALAQKIFNDLGEKVFAVFDKILQ